MTNAGAGVVRRAMVHVTAVAFLAALVSVAVGAGGGNSAAAEEPVPCLSGEDVNNHPLWAQRVNLLTESIQYKPNVEWVWLEFGDCGGYGTDWFGNVVEVPRTGPTHLVWFPVAKASGAGKGYFSMDACIYDGDSCVVTVGDKVYNLTTKKAKKQYQCWRQEDIRPPVIADVHRKPPGASPSVNIIHLWIGWDNNRDWSDVEERGIGTAISWYSGKRPDSTVEGSRADAIGKIAVNMNDCVPVPKKQGTVKVSRYSKERISATPGRTELWCNAFRCYTKYKSGTSARTEVEKGSAKFKVKKDSVTKIKKS